MYIQKINDPIAAILLMTWGAIAGLKSNGGLAIAQFSVGAIERIAPKI